MIEKGKISAFQLGLITYTAVTATGVLLLAITAAEAERDMWLSPLWTSITGYLIVLKQGYGSLASFYQLKAKREAKEPSLRFQKVRILYMIYWKKLGLCIVQGNKMALY